MARGEAPEGRTVGTRRIGRLARSKQLWWVAALTLTASAALGVRLARLDSEPFWLDEVCTANFNAGTVSSVLHAYATDVHPPLYGILLHLWSAVVGTSEAALRGYSTVFSILGLLFAVLLTREITGDRWAALGAGLLLAVNPLDIWYAREARMYEQAACLMTVATWVLWRWLRREDAARPPGTLAAAYGLLAALLLYTHYLAAVVLGAQVLAMLVLFSVCRRWRDAARLLGVTATAIVSFLPWVIYVRHLRPTLYSASQVGWIPKAHAVDVFGYLNHEFFLGFASPPSTAAGWFSVAAAGLLAVTVVGAASTGPHTGGATAHRPREAVALLLWLAIGPALVAAVISQLWHPVFFRPRFSLFCLAPTVVVLVVALAEVRPPLRTALVAVIAALVASGAAWQATSPTKEGLREMTRLATRFGGPEYALLLPTPHSILVRYYLPHAGLEPSRQELEARLRRATPKSCSCGSASRTGDCRRRTPATASWSPGSRRPALIAASAPPMGLRSMSSTPEHCQLYAGLARRNGDVVASMRTGSPSRGDSPGWSDSRCRRASRSGADSKRSRRAPGELGRSGREPWPLRGLWSGEIRDEPPAEGAHRVRAPDRGPHLAGTRNYADPTPGNLIRPAGT